MNSLEIIIDDPNANDLYGILPLRNNMTEPPLLKDQTISQRDSALIAVVALEILYYAQSEHFNILQRVNT